MQFLIALPRVPSTYSTNRLSSCPTPTHQDNCFSRFRHSFCSSNSNSNNRMLSKCNRCIFGSNWIDAIIKTSWLYEPWTLPTTPTLTKVLTIWLYEKSKFTWPYMGSIDIPMTFLLKHFQDSKVIKNWKEFIFSKTSMTQGCIYRRFNDDQISWKKQSIFHDIIILFIPLLVRTCIMPCHYLMVYSVL